MSGKIEAFPSPRRRCRWIAGFMLILAMLATGPAWATTDLFSFFASENGEHYSLVLAGREDPGAVELAWHGLGRGVLQGKAHRLEFDREHRRMRLEYVNPGDPSRPPSFRILVTGETGVLEFGERRIPGEANWEIP